MGPFFHFISILLYHFHFCMQLGSELRDFFLQFIHSIVKMYTMKIRICNLLVSDKRMCTSTSQPLRGLSLSSKSVAR